MLGGVRNDDLRDTLACQNFLNLERLVVQVGSVAVRASVYHNLLRVLRLFALQSELALQSSDLCILGCDLLRPRSVHLLDLQVVLLQVLSVAVALKSFQLGQRVFWSPVEVRRFGWGSESCVGSVVPAEVAGRWKSPFPTKL